MKESMDGEDEGIASRRYGGMERLRCWWVKGCRDKGVNGWKDKGDLSEDEGSGGLCLEG